MADHEVVSAKVERTEKGLIELAADIEGRTVSGFLRRVAVREANGIVGERVAAAEEKEADDDDGS